jgi:hypothetical protein
MPVRRYADATLAKAKKDRSVPAAEGGAVQKGGSSPLFRCADKTVDVGFKACVEPVDKSDRLLSFRTALEERGAAREAFFLPVPSTHADRLGRLVGCSINDDRSRWLAGSNWWTVMIGQINGLGYLGWSEKVSLCVERGIGLDQGRRLASLMG